MEPSQHGLLLLDKSREQIKTRKTLPAQRRPIIRVPPMDVLTTGITSANSVSNTLWQTHIKFIYKTIIINCNYIYI